MIDLVALKNSKELDEKLTQIFTHSDTLCIGFSFQSDLTIFERCFTNMHFYKTFTRFIELQEFYSAVYSTDVVTSLTKAVKELLGKEMCKQEQMSNWERRPLRLTQQHYSSLDAYILIDVFKKLLEVSKDKGQAADLENFVKTLTLEGTQKKPKSKSKSNKKKKSKASPKKLPGLLESAQNEAQINNVN